MIGSRNWIALAGLLTAIPSLLSAQVEPKAAVRTDNATGGRVLAAGTDAPVAGAKVEVIRIAWHGIPQPIQRHLPMDQDRVEVLTTDARGEFRTRVKIGDEIAVLARHGEQQSLCRAVLAGSFATLRLNPSRRVQGVVRRGPERKPVAGQRIQVYIPADSRHDLGRRLVVTTNAQGAYRCEIPQQTWYRITARGPGWFRERIAQKELQQDFLTWAAKPKLRERLMSAGKPLADCVLIQPHEPRCRTRTDAQGYFAFETVDKIPSAYSLPENTHARFHRYDTDAPPKLDVPAGRRVSLLVRDPRGEPYGNMRLVVAAPNPGTRLSYRSFYLGRSYRTNAEGRVTIAVYNPAPYVSIFADVGGRFSWVYRGDCDVGPRTIPLVLHRSISAIVQVADPNGTPIANQTFHVARLADANGEMWDTRPHILTLTQKSDHAGRIGFHGLQPGRYALVLNRPGEIPHVMELDVGARSFQTKWQLPKRHVLRVKVRAPKGIPAGPLIGTVHVVQDYALPIGVRRSTITWLYNTFKNGGRSTSYKNGILSFRSVPRQAVNVNVKGYWLQLRTRRSWIDAEIVLTR